MSTTVSSVVVVGVGNPWRGDDAAGLEAVARLASDATGISITRHEGDAIGLLDLWTGAPAVVIVDAIHSGAPAGTLHRFDASRTPLPVELSHGSSHAVAVGEAIELARALGRLPPRVVVHGVEGADYSARHGLSASVTAALEPLIRRVQADLDGLVVR